MELDSNYMRNSNKSSMPVACVVDDVTSKDLERAYTLYRQAEHHWDACWQQYKRDKTEANWMIYRKAVANRQALYAQWFQLEREYYVKLYGKDA